MVQECLKIGQNGSIRVTLAHELAIGGALSSMPTTDTGINTDLVTPAIPLQGQADPGQVAPATEEASLQMTDGLAQAQQALLDGPFIESIQLMEMTEQFTIDALQTPVFAELPEVPEMSQYLEWQLPDSVQAQVDAQNDAQFDTTIAEAQGKVTEAEAEWEAGRAHP